MCCLQAVSAFGGIDIEKCGSFSNFRSSNYLDVAVGLQSFPKEEAIEQLTEWAKSKRHELEVIALCRMLFTEKSDIYGKMPNGAKNGEIEALIGQKPSFRRPGLGSPIFVGMHGEVTSSQSDFNHFNLEPIIIVDGVPFWIVKMYLLNGKQESSSEYLAYCIKNLEWNPFRFKCSTKENSESAYNNLIEIHLNRKNLDSSELKFLHNQIETPVKRDESHP